MNVNSLYMIDDPRRLILVATNRGPVSFGFAEDGSLTARRGGGGVVSGMTSGLAALAASNPPTSQDDPPALWICAAMSEADRAAARRGLVDAGEGPGDAAVLMLDIPEV